MAFIGFLLVALSLLLGYAAFVVARHRQKEWEQYYERSRRPLSYPKRPRNNRKGRASREPFFKK